MSEQEKKPHPPEWARLLPEHTGKFAESDKKKLEAAVVDKLKSLGSKLTRKDIQELLSHVETAKSIEALKERLSVKTAEKAGDEALTEILALYNEIRKWAQEGIKELKIDLSKLLKSNERLLKKGIFLSERFVLTQKLEKSELWKNIVLDIAGVAVGAIDSVIVFLQILLELVVDVVKLPKHVHEHVKGMKKKG